ncbi:MarR family winged helix-turn-helix transcriptional regulator [Spirosoma litoris]
MESTTPQFNNLILLLNLLGHLVDAVYDQLTQLAKKQGYGSITRSQLITLYQFRNGMNCMDMVRLQGISKQAVSLHLNQLCAKGYLQSQSSMDDHRSTHYFLTQRGIGLRQAINTWWLASQASIESQLGSSILQQVTQELPMLITIIEKSETKRHKAPNKESQYLEGQ